MVNQLNESSSWVQGTDLGLYRRDELSEELQSVVAGLKSGEFSEILDTGSQFVYRAYDPHGNHPDSTVSDIGIC